MMRRIAVCLVSLLLTAPAWAQEAQETESPPATGGSGAPDLSKMGPWTRKPANEAKVRKEIQAFIKEGDAIMKQRNWEASLAQIDFPLYMATDNSQGVPEAEEYDRQKYTETMKPMFDQMPADAQVTHKPTITVLSDSLATITDDYTTTHGGKTLRGRYSGLLVKRDGAWKWKAMYEAGWGDYEPPAVGGAGASEDQENPQ